MACNCLGHTTSPKLWPGCRQATASALHGRRIRLYHAGLRRHGALVCQALPETEAVEAQSRSQDPQEPAVHSETKPTTTPSEPGGEAGTWEGYAELLSVSLLWGAYNPTLKLIYAEEHALSASTLTAVRTVLSAMALLGAVAIQGKSRQAQANEDTGLASVGMGDPVWSEEGGTVFTKDPNRTGWLSYSFVGVLPAGIELGLYNFAGTAAQAMGLQLTSATRASFLVQLTAVLVPVLSFLAGEKISSRTWTAVAIGLAGSLLVAYDGIMQHAGMGTGGSSADELKGMALIVLSVTSYSLATVRLGTYAPRFDSVDLTAIKKVALSAASLVWFFDGLPAGGQHMSFAEQLQQLGLTGRPLASYALIVFSALGPGAGATFLQTKGQASVPATAAQVIYSLTPLWSTLLAHVLLGDEGMGPLSWLGGAAVLSASLLSAQAQADAPRKET